MFNNLPVNRLEQDLMLQIRFSITPDQVYLIVKEKLLIILRLLVQH